MAEITKIDNSDNLLPLKTTDKKTLVLDLDETLVHSQFQPFDVPSDITLKIELEGEIHDIHVLVRPGVKEFLENMGKIYEIVIFTASVSKYADPLLDILDKNKNCKFRLFREHCTPINTCFVKEIKKLGRELKDIVIVDNSPMSYALNPENGLPILTWFDDKEDRELYNISSILEFLSFVPDVRKYINQFVVNDEISYNNVINVFDRYNEMLNQKNNNNENNKSKSKDNKKIINKNNSKTKYNGNNNNPRLISENKENIGSIGNNTLIKNNNILRFKKNITFANLKQKNNATNIKINLNINKKARPNSKINNKSKDNKNNTKNIIANVENRENVNPNIVNFNKVNRLNNIITGIPNLNQTTKNKDTKNISFDPSSIIASAPNPQNSNIDLIPNTTTHKNSFSFFNNNININKNRYNTSNNQKSKVKNKIIKHRKSDSISGLKIPKKIYENNTTLPNNNNNSSNFKHSNSIVLKDKTKMTNNYLTNSTNNFTLSNYTSNALLTRVKNNKDFQLSVRISRDIGQELNKIEFNTEKNEKTNKKISKSLNKEKISVSFSSNINNNYNNKTFNKSTLIKTCKTNENSNYIYHKKHKSINASSIPFPSTTKNADSKLFDKKYNFDSNKNKINSIINYNKNSFNYNKHKRFLSTSESYTTNFLNNLYSSNTSNVNHSIILGMNTTTNGNNTNNIFLNHLSYKNKQRNPQQKMNQLMESNAMKTERNKENYSTNYNNYISKEKKKENKIPFNIIKKRNSLNENGLKKKIPSPGNGNKNLFVNLNMNMNDSKNLGYHKKHMSYNPEIVDTFATRPKSTKQVIHNKKINYNKANYKVAVNISNNFCNLKKAKGIDTGNNNTNMFKKEISVSKSSRPNN